MLEKPKLVAKALRLTLRLNYFTRCHPSDAKSIQLLERELIRTQGRLTRCERIMQGQAEP
jgi:hypothetical protein